MIKGKTVKSVEQFEREFYPESLLERLTKKLVFHLFPVSEGAHTIKYSLSKNENNPKTGSIEILKPESLDYENYGNGIEEIIINFYKGEGYKVEKVRNSITVNSPEIQKKKEDYTIYVFEDKNSYNIRITL